MRHHPDHIRGQFPILQSGIIYLDTAATSQKPQAVIDAMHEFYRSSNANVNRGVHALGEKATIAYENARKSVQRFINAKKSHEVIFTRGTTEAINCVARSWGEANLQKGDVIVLSILEHHSNIVPWLQLKEKRGIGVEWIDIDDKGNIDLDGYKKILENGKVRLLSITGLSNVLGVAPPVKDMIDLAHHHGALAMIDAAQMAAHMPIDVQELDCDFLAFSGHKIYGPTGIGVLYAKENILNAMPPFLGGGDMIQTVEKGRFTPAELPRKFEAGTPPIAEAVGLHAAIDWIESINLDAMMKHEKELITIALAKLSTIPKITILGPNDAELIHGCISFTIDGIHPHDLTQILSDNNIYLRAGHHCTQPLHDRLKIPASTRLSIGPYNSTGDIEKCVSEIVIASQKF